jgi:hypothetical protein
MFGQVTAKYAALVASAYGVSPSDINFAATGNGGETLAGSIRQERKTRRMGLARAEKKLKYFFDRLLPEGLMFSWVDVDDELSVALGRARLASITAAGLAVDKRIVTPKEARLQLIADGLYNISMPEDIPEDEFDILQDTNPMLQQQPFGAKRPGMLGTQVPPSSGGQGEVKQSVFESDIDYGIDRMIEALENKSESFNFLPDTDGIAEEWLYLVGEDRSEEVKAKISDYLKNVVPERFAETYAKIQPLLELENADQIGSELAEMRYNLVDDFSKEVIKIAEESSNVKTKKNPRRRNSNGRKSVR